MTPIKDHIIVIVGPTASGKSGLAIELAKKYDGEIISADSRQIYRGMDIGTGKVTRDPISCRPELVSGPQENKESPANSSGIPDQVRDDMPGILKQVQHDNALQSYISEGIPHHLIDIREPNEDYNVTDFKRDARTAIEDIRSRGKLLIICGGTGFWVQALVDNQTFPEVPPNPKLREELSKLSREELFEQLKSLDPDRAETIDAKNPVRLIRAIEIAINRQQTTHNAQPNFSRPELVSGPQENKESPANSSRIPGPRLPDGQEVRDDMSGMLNPPAGGQHDNLYHIIALNPPKEILDAKIKKRLDERFDQGMIDEVCALHEQGVSWERLEAFGLEYRWIARFLQNKISEREMREKLYFDIVHYAKRQLTWLRRWERQGAKIHWIQDADNLEKEWGG